MHKPVPSYSEFMSITATSLVYDCVHRVLLVLSHFSIFPSLVIVLLVLRLLSFVFELTPSIDVSATSTLSFFLDLFSFYSIPSNSLVVDVRVSKGAAVSLSFEMVFRMALSLMVTVSGVSLRTWKGTVDFWNNCKTINLMIDNPH